MHCHRQIILSDIIFLSSDNELFHSSILTGHFHGSVRHWALHYQMSAPKREPPPAPDRTPYAPPGCARGGSAGEAAPQTEGNLLAASRPLAARQQRSCVLWQRFKLAKATVVPGSCSAAFVLCCWTMLLGELDDE